MFQYARVMMDIPVIPSFVVYLSPQLPNHLLLVIRAILLHAVQTQNVSMVNVDALLNIEETRMKVVDLNVQIMLIVPEIELVCEANV